MQTQDLQFQSERLRLARTAKGLTQASLADQLGVKRQFIHQFEHDERTPNDMTLNALADVLDVHPHFFMRQVKHVITHESVNFRKLKSVTKTFQSKIVARSTILSEVIRWLEKYVELRDIEIPQHYLDISGTSIEQVTQLVRDFYGVGLNSPIDNVTTLMESAGVICVQVGDTSEKISALSVDTHRPLVMHNVLNKQASRMRFDLCHELGHFVMHKGTPTGDDLTEQQANSFASAFLLPQKAFINECPLRDYRQIDWKALSEFKQRWNVSFQAIFRRAFDLGLIGAAQYKKGHILINTKGWAKKEPYEHEAEKPSVMNDAAKILNFDFSIYLDDIEKEFGITKEFVKLLGIEISENLEFQGNVVNFKKYAFQK